MNEDVNRYFDFHLKLKSLNPELYDAMTSVKVQKNYYIYNILMIMFDEEEIDNLLNSYHENSNTYLYEIFSYIKINSERHEEWIAKLRLHLL